MVVSIGVNILLMRYCRLDDAPSFQDSTLTKESPQCTVQQNESSKIKESHIPIQANKPFVDTLLRTPRF
jgi:hypothetical protein